MRWLQSGSAGLVFASACVAAAAGEPTDALRRLGECSDAACSAAVERDQLAASDGLATRDGPRLCFGAPTSTCLVDDDNPEHSKYYRYLGKLSTPSMYVVDRLSWGEEQDVVLVDARSGRQQVVAEVPVPSPDGRYLAVGRRNERVGDSVAIYRVHDDGLQMELELAPDWSPGTPVWLGPTRVKFPVHAHDAADTGADTQRVYERGGNGWHEVVEPERRRTHQKPH